jgi:hypothetical protein
LRFKLRSPASPMISKKLLRMLIPNPTNHVQHNFGNRRTHEDPVPTYLRQAPTRSRNPHGNLSPPSLARERNPLMARGDNGRNSSFTTSSNAGGCVVVTRTPTSQPRRPPPTLKPAEGHALPGCIGTTFGLTLSLGAISLLASQQATGTLTALPTKRHLRS